ncbi:formate dehydrogenase subunit gamma [Halarcobacter sp.]|uniref:formate dehydrogenase subunit gamma n=1 Tax=Halarcobacter sp. TaxID=2321133 RepID=UPI0029F4F836|nr:formate dehydrogenase subunit gamma [Halarcobacter sp.]
MKLKYIVILLLALGSLAIASDSAIWGKDLIPNILAYDKEGSLHLGKIFTLLQGKYFSMVFLAIALGVPAVFLLHYLVIGPMIFSHDRKKIPVFTIFHRVIHWLAGISFIVLVPTGLIMIFGSSFGGGSFVRVCKELHAIATPLFCIAVIPMLLMWLKEMLPTSDDIKWMMIMGGYLNKRKDPIPAGKFNAGQKMWFWLCTLGGIVMILTGAAMYFQDFNLSIIKALEISQIDFLRGSAIVHNILGMAVVALFMTHIYMSVFAIKGAIHSMISGLKEEEEVEILHSTYYKKLKKEQKI